MKIPVHLRSLLLLCVILSKAVGMAETIDPNKPLTESLLPDLLYFNFDGEDDGSVISQSELGLTASMETGHVDMPPTRRPGPREIFGHALEFNYGDHPAFTDSNDSIAGNHLRIEDDPSLRLAGQSFTLGAWIQLPEDAELPPRPYKKLIGKGGHADSYPGWSLQLSGREGTWHLTLLLVGPDNVQTRRDARVWLEPGVWHHVASSFDAESKEVIIWLDGTPAFTGEAATDIGESPLPLVIGENGMSTYSNITLSMDEVFIVSGVHDFLPVEH